MLKYIEKPQNTYIQSSMVTEIQAREKCVLLWCLRTVPVCDIILGVSGGWARATTIAFLRYRQMQLSDLGKLAVYSGWKSMDNYDTCASVFVVLFNGFMSLTSYFDVMYSY